MVYNGGLCQARVRYFDPERGRPGLPEGVAALVEGLEPERVVVGLVNLSGSETRRLIVQAGAFGEHRFTEVRCEDGPGEGKTVRVDGKHLEIEMPRSTSIRMAIGMQRFVNRPTYAFPWHGDKVPAVFRTEGE